MACDKTGVLEDAMKKRLGQICFLSGLIIPTGKYSVEHYVPKSRAPLYITDSQFNKFPSHKVINAIKGNLLPCEWEEMKWDLSYKAVHSWNIRNDDKVFVEKALKNWQYYIVNPCDYCLLQCKQRGF